MTLSFNSLNFRFRCLFFLCMLITPVFDYTISGNILTDLVSATLASEVSYWTVSSYATAGVKIYQCGSTYILGGYNILAGSGSTYSGQYFQTTYSGLPSHNQINLSIKIYALDSWDAISGVDDHFTVSFDGRELYGWAIYGYLGPYTSPLCGNAGYPDYPPFTMKITVPHIDSAVTLRITSYLDENSINESVGFRDITMTFVYQEEPGVTICGVSPSPLPDKPCPCDYSNQYMSPVQSGTCINCAGTCATCTGSASTACLSCYAGNTYFKDFQCLACDSTCATCFGAGANQCSTCIANYNMVSNTCYPASDCTSPLYTSESGGINYCNSPCPGSYAYWDSSCSTVCPLPRVVTVVDSFSLCTYPCTSTQYLYWNGTCSSTCAAPYEVVVSKTKNFCVWPCGSGQYAYWDNTCDSACAPPLIKYSEGSPNVKNFCAYPCQLYEYLYWNGTCSDTCDAPLVASTKHGRQFCTYPCLLTDFLYFNGSCLNSCPAPLSIRVVDARSYCDYGCIDELEYLYWNGSCGSCPSPLIQKIDAGKKFCVFQCDPTEFLYWDGSCQSTCSPPLTQDPEGSPMTRYYCNFPCDSDQYLYWNGTCSSTCPSPLTSSTANSRKFCNYPCASTEYLYWDGTCSSTCPSPYEGRFEGRPTRNYCDYPCEGTDSLYWNGTCASCSSPLTSRVTSGKNYCDYPCLTTEYLYWEGSCNSTCASPLVQDVQGNSVTRNFCQFPCAESEYMYWNGTCSSKCPYPLEAGSEYGRLICNYPCPVSEYLYYNATCETSCPLPLSNRTESLRNYCDYPCKSYEYLAWDGTCFDFCDSPYVITTYSGYQFCNLPCYADYYYFPYTHSCNASCDYPYTNNTDLVYLRCYPAEDLDYAGGLLEAPANPGTVTFVTLVKLMQYVRYLDVDFPPRFQRFQVSRGRPVLSTNFGIQLGDSAQVPFERHPSVIETYTKNNLRASFLVNFWNDLTTILIFVLAGIVVAIFEKVCKRIHFETFALILERFRVILKWNFPLMLLACFVDDVILFSALEFMTLAHRSESVSASAVSFAFSAVFVVFEIVLMLFIIYIVRLSRSLHPKGEGIVPMRLQGFQVLYRGFKTDSFPNQYFFLIYMSRIGLSMIVAVCCESMPLLGIFFQVSFSMIILAYLVLMRPFVKKVNQYQLILYEFGVFLLNICVGLLTVIGVSNSSFPTASNYLMNIVILGNDALNIMLLVFLAIKLYLESASLSEANKKHGVKGMRRLIAYLQLLSLPLQQGNMGFEEMIDYEIYSNKKSWTRAVTPVKVANYVNMKEMALQGGSPLSTTNLYSIDKLDSPESRRGLTGKGMMMDVSALSNGEQRTRILDESTVGEIRLIKQSSTADPMGSLIELNSPPKGKYFNPNDEEQLYNELYKGGLLTNSPPQKPLKPIRRSPSQSRLRLLRQSSAAEPMGSLVDLSSPPIQRNPNNPHGEEFFNPFVARGEPMSMAQDFDDQWYRENGSIYQGLAPSRLLYNGSPNRSSVANEVRLLRQSSVADQTGYSIDLGSPGKTKNEQFFNSQFNNRDSPNIELEEDELWYTEKDQNPDETLSRSIYANTSIRYRDRIKKKLTRKPTRTYTNAEKLGSYLNY